MSTLYTDKLSALNTNVATSSLDVLNFKQFQRTYSGGFHFNFIDALSGAVDFSSKNFSNFYLTSPTTLDSIVYTDDNVVESKSIFTTLRFGEDYFTACDLDTRTFRENDDIQSAKQYRAYKLSQTPVAESYFTITFLNSIYCTISVEIDRTRFYLVSDINKTVLFQREDLIENVLDSIRPQFFQYGLDLNYNFIYLVKPYTDGVYSLRRSGNTVSVSQPISSLSNYTFLQTRISLDRSVTADLGLKLNTSFITYQLSSNNIDLARSDFDLKNNYLLHKSGNFANSNVLNIMNLKNQVLRSGDIASGNNLLSGAANYSVSDLRNYTSIFNDIPQETSESLELNYTFSNFDIHIKSGENYFRSPDTLEPFQQLNINDTSFVKCGAFSFNVPLLADRVYLIDDKVPETQQQHYLCTWLSGAPTSQNKVWVDRYYYPDYITKAQALVAQPIFVQTYNDPIEQLIRSNTAAQDSIDQYQYFDKRSDLLILPSRDYNYHRVSLGDFQIIDPIDYSNPVAPLSSSNLYKAVNESGQFTLGFVFKGDATDFTITSKRNSVDSGLSISLSVDQLTVDLIVYDYSTQSYTSLINAKVTTNQYKENSVIVDFDSVAGVARFYLNGKLVQQSTTGVYRFTKRTLLYGDLVVSCDTNTIPVLYFNNKVYSSDLIIALIFYLQKTTIQDITIAIPCGLRNGTDNIAIINSVCGSQQSKSNYIDIKVKNTNIASDSILESIQNEILLHSSEILPVTTGINSITFENYK